MPAILGAAQREMNDWTLLAAVVLCEVIDEVEMATVAKTIKALSN
jgi:hypothetical protein